MHILFLAPEHPAPHWDYVRALKQVGLRISGIGHQDTASLAPQVQPYLDAYEGVKNLASGPDVLAAARRLERLAPIDRVEAVDERLTLPAAELRQALGVPGLSVKSANLCRDKTAMKERLRSAGIPCAASAAVASLSGLRAFAESVGFPLILKPRAGLGAQQTFRVETVAELEAAGRSLGVPEGHSVAVEEFIEGHEGFFDTLAVDGEVRHEFISHYYPNVLIAMQNRRIAPQIASTNRLHRESYAELREMGRKVIRALGIGTSATHMEWFYGPRGLKFSEIGARPPGERIWDLYCAGNEVDLYREWALMVAGRPPETPPSRRYASGSIQVRPECDGRITAYEGLGEVWRVCGPWIHASRVPPPGSATRPMRLGYLENTWFRLHHPDYDHLLRMMDFIGGTVVVKAKS